MDSSEATVNTASAPRKPVVLVVDDDSVHHRLFRLIADRLQVTAKLVSSGEEALSVLETESFDLILMDCRMPGIDGHECTMRIRKLEREYKNIPIIAVTACVLPGDREKCMRSGMNDFLGKPFTLEELNAKINQWLPQVA
jgi:CheY-like chemotaxis protein